MSSKTEDLIAYWRELAEAEGLTEGDTMTDEKADFVLRGMEQTTLAVYRFVPAVLGVNISRFNYYLYRNNDFAARYKEAQKARLARTTEDIVRRAHRTAVQMASGYWVEEPEEIIKGNIGANGEKIPDTYEDRKKRRWIQPDGKFVMRVLEKHAADLMSLPGVDGLNDLPEIILLRNGEQITNTSLLRASGAAADAPDFGESDDAKRGDEDAAPVGQD